MPPKVILPKWLHHTLRHLRIRVNMPKSTNSDVGAGNLGGARTDPGSDGFCPICLRNCSPEQLHAHIRSEDPRRRQKTIEVIRAYNPGWSPEHGACESCWNSFRDAGRVLAMLKGANQRHPVEVSHFPRSRGEMAL